MKTWKASNSALFILVPEDMATDYVYAYPSITEEIINMTRTTFLKKGSWFWIHLIKKKVESKTQWMSSKRKLSHRTEHDSSLTLCLSPVHTFTPYEVIPSFFFNYSFDLKIFFTACHPFSMYFSPRYFSFSYQNKLELPCKCSMSFFCLLPLYIYFCDKSQSLHG